MIGANGGNQQNIFLFEVGFVRRESSTADENVVTVGVHPLVVAPQNVTYTDASRSNVTQTLGAISRLVGDRALRVVTLAGMFGVEERGFGTYVGTGPQRWQRFYNEVVRFSDARSADDVAAVINDLSGTFGVRERLASFDAATCTPFVNFYDLLNQRQFAVNIDSFVDTIQSRMGGATGNRSYSLRLLEAGPIVASKLTDQVLKPLFSGMTLWKNAIDVVRGYDEEAILNALPSLSAVAISNLTSSVQATAARSTEARAIFGGTRRPVSQDAMLAFSGATDDLIQAVAVAAQQGSVDVDDIDAPPGRITDWFARSAFPGLDAAEAVEAVEQLGASAAEQRSMGAFLGLAREAFLRVVATGGTSLRSTSTATVDHVVSARDTVASLEARYSARWEDVLELNRLTPDEAMTPGVTLKIPTQRINGPRYIDGLPTFGSQAGRAAWGGDVTMDLAVDGDGALVVLTGPDVLVQGVQMLYDELAAQLFDDASPLPGTTGDNLIARKMVQALLSDRRMLAVTTVDVSRADAAVSVRLDVRPINTSQTVPVVL